MKKTNFCSAALLLLFSFENSIYELNVQDIKENMITMSAFKNKKILITTISTDTDTGQLKWLDSLQKANTLLNVIVVPALDFGIIKNNNALADLTDSVKLNFLVTKPVYINKNMSAKQSPLFTWLTNAKNNEHFDINADAAGQFFIISKSGKLYSVLPPNVPAETLNQVLNQDVE